MSPDKQRIAIAEACGWVRPHMPKLPLCWRAPENYTGKSMWLPDYLNDLNEMHAAERVLTKAQKLAYQVEIGDVSYRHNEYDGGFASWHYIHASPQARAEAFLRAIGKWEEVQS